MTSKKMEDLTVKKKVMTIKMRTWKVTVPLLVNGPMMKTQIHKSLDFYNIIKL